MGTNKRPLAINIFNAFFYVLGVAQTISNFAFMLRTFFPFWLWVIVEQNILVCVFNSKWFCTLIFTVQMYLFILKLCFMQYLIVFEFTLNFVHHFGPKRVFLKCAIKWTFAWLMITDVIITSLYSSRMSRWK